MSSNHSKIDTGMSVGLIISAVIHVAVFLLFAWWGTLAPPLMAIQETYYVDVVNLPTAVPQVGSSAQQPDETEIADPAAVPEMLVPPVTKTVPKGIAKPVKPSTAQQDEAHESAFAERLAKLEKKGEAQREEAVLEKLRNKVKGGGNAKVGMPEAGGVAPGSRYADYVKSRLEDALKLTSSYSTRKPEVVVRLVISVDGRISRMKIEQSSGDVTFELAVRRAIDLASEKFTPPPNQTAFENIFVFRPKSISGTTSR